MRIGRSEHEWPRDEQGLMAWWLAVLLWGFGLNAVWEYWHSVLYVHYRGRPITGLVLLRAALVDSFIILGMVGVARVLPNYRLA